MLLNELMEMQANHQTEDDYRFDRIMRTPEKERSKADQRWYKNQVAKSKLEADEEDRYDRHEGRY